METENLNVRSIPEKSDYLMPVSPRLLNVFIV